MRKNGQKGPRRRWCRRFVFVLLFPFCFLLGLNLFLATPWGAGVFERRVEAKIGLPCDIGGMTWSPWTGVRIQDIRLMPPRDSEERMEILKIESVEVDLSWQSLVKGQKRFERVEIRGITGEVSLELLQSMIAHGQIPKRPESIVPGVLPNSPLVAEEAQSSAAPASEAPAKPESARTIVPDPVEQASPVVPVDDFQGVIVFKGVNFRLYSRRFPELSAAVSDVSGEIPIWGGDRAGFVTIEDLKLGERFHSQKIEVPVNLEDRFLKVTDYQVKLFGLNLDITAAVWMVPGLPYGLQVELPSQQIDLSPLSLHDEPPFSIEALRSYSQVKGHLLNPGDISGGSYTTFKNLEILDGVDGSRTRFSSGSAQFQVVGAGLIARDFRIMGEQEAVLGNGFAIPGGNVAAVVRIVASPDRAESHESRVKRASDHLELKFEPLVTPDREFRDLHLELRSGNLMIDLGRDRQWVPFFPVARAIAGSRASNISLYP